MSAHEMAARPATSERTEVWRREMSEEDLEVFERIAGDTLADLGYAVTARR
jgi:hypothetical protein